ncbi:Eco29kI family restriction endonuclease [Streptomyces sp. ID05-26A]|nr:Eco29kI family restriction endonuclease [Streptomyces sp. ID05-26A]
MSTSDRKRGRQSKRDAESVNYVPASFDPLSTEQISTTICERFERQPLVAMGSDLPQFEGAGLYAIYYRGEGIEFYRPLSNLQIPVYVGRARSIAGRTNKVNPKRLFGRLRDHRESIIGGNLPVAEFRFRALLMPDVHIDLGENGLVNGYRPVWNVLLTGFGGREQGQRTRQATKTKWDTVHAGRKRTDGGTTHDASILIEEMRAHIEKQVADYDDLPWPHPGGRERLINP